MEWHAHPPLVGDGGVSGNVKMLILPKISDLMNHTNKLRFDLTFFLSR